jgi:hypothetical protein
MAQLTPRAGMESSRGGTWRARQAPVPGRVASSPTAFADPVFKDLYPPAIRQMSCFPRAQSQGLTLPVASL